METLPKDVMLIILSNLDDKTLFNFFKTNRYGNELCKNEHFWRNRLISRFKLNEEKVKSFKTKGSWKDFYLKIIHYMNGTTINIAMGLAAKGGHLDLVNFFIEKGADNWNDGMFVAAEGGHLDLVKFFIEKGVNNWNYGMHAAAEGGHFNLIKFFIEKGANNWERGMEGAARGGHLDIVKFFIEKGANNWDFGMMQATYGGHSDLVKFFEDKKNLENKLGIRI